jgi:hypothetical protein
MTERESCNKILMQLLEQILELPVVKYFITFNLVFLQPGGLKNVKTDPHE